MKKAFLFNKLNNKRIQCLNCNHKCVISEGNYGICGIRKNNNGILYNVIYNKIISECVDPIEKKPIYNFLPRTYTYSIACIGCNFKCDWCQNFEISQMPKKGLIEGEIRKPTQIIKSALKNNCKSISYTYTEPTVWSEFVYETSILAKKSNLKNIWVTNGYFSEECLGLFLKRKLIDAMNIDLKSFNKRTYKKYCGADLNLVLKSIKDAYKSGIHTEITTLIIPGINDSELELKEIGQFIFGLDNSGNIPWHVSRFFPCYKMLNNKITPIGTLYKAKIIGEKIGLKFVYIGNVI